ncbi:MAG: aminotransferase class V-fold PLP-dependent enzyme, partial [bacterium]
KDTEIEPLMIGGSQERGFRAGTENVAGIVGLGQALLLAEKMRVKESKRLVTLRDYFINKILKNIEGVIVNGNQKLRLPNNVNISIKGVEGESLLLMMDEAGIACSTGSACSATDLEPSYVLLAIGSSLEMAHCSIRFSLGRMTTKKDLDFVVKALEKCVCTIRRMSGFKKK